MPDARPGEFQDVEQAGRIRRVPAQIYGGGVMDAAHLVKIHSLHARAQAMLRPSLDLDKNDHVAVPGDQVDFPVRRPETALQHLKHNAKRFQSIINREVRLKFTPRLIWEFSSSTALSLFFAFILGGIALYGNSRLQLRAVEDNDESWMKTAFSGFKIPLELAWLTFRVSLVYIFWMVLALIPAAALVALFFSAVPTPQTPAELSMSVAVVTLASVIFIAIYCIPFYKYRYLFRIKADHPDWSAGECMRHCREIVYGSKWRIFVHDCSYWRILLGALLPLLVIMAVVLLATAILGGRSAGAPTPSAAVAVGAAFGVVAMLAAYLALLVFGAISVHYIGVGQSILYREISRAKTNQQ